VAAPVVVDLDEALAPGSAALIEVGRGVDHRFPPVELVRTCPRG
jgi:hypothetical protein